MMSSVINKSPQQIKFNFMVTADEVKTSDENITVKISSIKTQERKSNKSCLLHYKRRVIRWFCSKKYLLLLCFLFCSFYPRWSRGRWKEIENKEIETKHKIKINFSKKDFYKICVFILALRLAPKNVFFGYNLRFCFHK